MEYHLRQIYTKSNFCCYSFQLNTTVAVLWLCEQGDRQEFIQTSLNRSLTMGLNEVKSCEEDNGYHLECITFLLVAKFQNCGK